ncbi:cyclin-O [Discoglossus pictus]
MVTCSVRYLEHHLTTAEKPLSPCKRKRQGGFPEDGTPQHRDEDSPCSGNMRAKKAKYMRHRKQRLMLRSCDSGVCDLYETPTPSPSKPIHRRARDPCDTCPRVSDRLDLQAFRDYGEACYQFKKSLEEKFMAADSLENQPQLKAESRCKLISWLIPVHRHFNLGFESLCLAVNILDRFLSCTPVASDCFQLVGVTSLLIACKQVETRPPRVKQLLALCCDTFSREQLCNLECIILLKLRFLLGAPTINFFLHHFSMLKVADVEPSEMELSRVSKSLMMAKGVAELSLADYAFNSYPPSLMATCCLALADRMLCQESPLLLNASGYPDSLLEECMDKIELLVSLNQDSLHSLLPSELTDKTMEVDI